MDVNRGPEPRRKPKMPPAGALRLRDDGKDLRATAAAELVTDREWIGALRSAICQQVISVLLAAR